jgi:DNA-binding response OmpR family regulator
MSKVLIAEDDQSLGVALRDSIEYEGHTVVLAKDGDSTLRMVFEFRPDVVLLDVRLPKASGLEVCRRLRADGNDVPIIMLTSCNQEMDKVIGLKSGADDYVTKPFSFSELMARVEALLRRSKRLHPADSYEFADIRLDFRAYEARKGDQPLSLSSREFRLLEYFIAHRGEVVGRDQLLDAVWGYEGRSPLTRTVDMHIVKLRQKIEDAPNEPRHIVTVHGIGYKFNG